MLNSTNYQRNAMRDHLTLARIAILKKFTNNKCWESCGEKGSLLHCWWECKLVLSLWRTVWTFLKKLKIELPCDPAIPLWGIYPEKMKTVIWKDTGTPNVHSSTIYNSQDMEATKVSINRGMDKEDAVYIYVCVCIHIYYNEILLSHKKMKSCHLWQYNIDGSGVNYAKWNVRQRGIPHDFIYMWTVKNKLTKWKQTHKYREQTDICQRGGETEWNRWR